MVHQASQVNGRHHNDAPGLERNVSMFSHELVKLGELQLRLFEIEGRQAARKLWVAITIVFLALASLVGGGIIGLAGTALFLDTHTRLSTWGAFVVTGAAAFFVAGLLVVGAAYVFRANRRTLFQHSVDALSDNIECIKSVLSRSQTN